MFPLSLFLGLINLSEKKVTIPWGLAFLPAIFVVSGFYPAKFCLNIISYAKTIKQHKSSDNVNFRPSAGFRWISLHEFRIFF